MSAICGVRCNFALRRHPLVPLCTQDIVRVLRVESVVKMVLSWRGDVFLLLERAREVGDDHTVQCDLIPCNQVQFCIYHLQPPRYTCPNVSCMYSVMFAGLVWCESRNPHSFARLWPFSLHLIQENNRFYVVNVWVICQLFLHVH